MNGVLFLQRLPSLGSVLSDGRQFVLQFTLSWGEAQRAGDTHQRAVSFLTSQFPG